MKKNWPLWEIFVRSKNGLEHRHFGSLHATDAEMALENARDVYTRRNEGVSIWVVESKYITASNPQENGELFEPAQDKIYRHPTFYELPDEFKTYVMKDSHLVKYILGIADNTLILGQRLGELCGHGPTLETDIALTNMSLDLLGQTRNYYQYIAKIIGEDKTEDDIAFLRTEREYLNVLLVEQPNQHFGYVIARQFYFDVFHYLLLQKLQLSTDENLAAIAKKSIKEVSYHQRFSSDWIKRLGDGTEVSHEKIQKAINDLWAYTDELFEMTDDDTHMSGIGIGVHVVKIKAEYYEKVSEVLKESTLEVPDNKYFKKGGKVGIHSEHMGFILADLQYMQRTYPNMKW